MQSTFHVYNKTGEQCFGSINIQHFHMLHCSVTVTQQITYILLWQMTHIKHHISFIGVQTLAPIKTPTQKSRWCRAVFPPQNRNFMWAAYISALATKPNIKLGTWLLVSTRRGVMSPRVTRLCLESLVLCCKTQTCPVAGTPPPQFCSFPASVQTLLLYAAHLFLPSEVFTVKHFQGFLGVICLLMRWCWLSLTAGSHKERKIHIYNHSTVLYLIPAHCSNSNFILEVMPFSLFFFFWANKNLPLTRGNLSLTISSRA